MRYAMWPVPAVALGVLTAWRFRQQRAENGSTPASSDGLTLVASWGLPR